MPPNTTYEYGPQPGQQPPSGTQLPIKKIAVAVCALAVLLAAWVIFAALAARAGMGTLSVQSSDAGAEVSISRANRVSEVIGRGTFTARLDPGTYTISAKAGDREAAKTVSITQGQTTDVNLNPPKTVAVDTIAPHSANSILASGDSLFFLNTEVGTPFNLRIGDTSGQPFQSSLYPVSSLQWITPTSFYVLEGGIWKYVQGSTANELRAGARTPVSGESAGFNAAGAYAYISNDNSIIVGSGPTAQPANIGKADRGEDRVSVAPDGRVLLFSTRTTVANSKPRIYKDGTLSELGADVSGMQHAVWSPGNDSIAYSTKNGFSVLKLGDKSPRPVALTNPTNPFSPVWIDAGSFLYAHAQTIWKYSVQSGTSVKVASFEGDMSAPAPFSLAGDGQTVYFGTARDSAGKGGKLYRTYPNYHSLSAEQQGLLKQSAPAAPATQTSYTGFEGLLNPGVSISNVDGAKYAVGQFLKARNLQAKQVSILEGSIASAPGEIGADFNTVNFTLRIDGTSYPARLDHSSLSGARLFVSDAAGRQLYDSGLINN